MEKVNKTKSKYALKVAAQFAGTHPNLSNTKPHRMGDCRHPLQGRRGHGFPTKSGRSIVCGECFK